MQNRILIYMNLLAASAVDLGVVVALVRSGADQHVIALAGTVALLPLLLVPTVVMHRRVMAALPSR